MRSPTPPNALTAALVTEHVSYETIPHRRTESAFAEARAIGIDPAHVAKTIVLITGEGFVRAVVPASERIDLAKVKEALGLDDVQFATEQVLAGAYPEFELGAVPPVGGAAGDRVLVDRRVIETPSVVFEAGTHEHSVRLRTADLVSVVDADVADICVVTASKSCAETLEMRVDSLTHSHAHRWPPLQSAATRATLHEIVAHVAGLEAAVHEMAKEIERLESETRRLEARATDR